MNPIASRRTLRRGDSRRRLALAFCTGVAVLAGHTDAGFAGSENLTRYTTGQVRAGAVTLTLPAQLEYRYGIQALKRGEADEAEKHLKNALALLPSYPDAHFTLARLYAARFSPDAVYHLSQGVMAILSNFDAQSTLAVNAGVMIALVFLFALAIAWISLAMRYLPFLAHRIGETLKKRFNAAVARVCAFLLLLAPLALMPGYTTAMALILVATFSFMRRRERVFTFILTSLFAALMWFTPWLDRFGTVADPTSLVSLIARANESPANPELAGRIEAADVPGLAAERETALGILAMRARNDERAVEHFIAAISLQPDKAIAYVNVGNVYYVNAQYNKALEGYRKAEQVDSTDAIGQYNLAQAYIRTLLMSESSHALERASQIGFARESEEFAAAPRATWSVYPRIYGRGDLWNMAVVEGRYRNPGVLAHALESAMWQSPRTSFWIAMAGLLVALASLRFMRRHGIAFQCGNCGEITCDGCCSGDRGSFVCQACAQAVGGVTSDKVLDALLRQRRQTVIVRRRKSMRWLTAWLPGVRHVFYGRFASGFALAALFSFSLLNLWMRGYPLPHWATLPGAFPLWKSVLPSLGIALSYAIAIMSRQLFETRTTRTGTTRARGSEGLHDDATSQSA
jgi:tetratricopeptide (TPR) repeat protein